MAVRAAMTITVTTSTITIATMVAVILMTGCHNYGHQYKNRTF
jgi:hypothetical protein